ncbi:hypothetical protein EVAR_51326_1 [Eumeta japonica]|uniref:Uncharacterized protein n=1 Tax=Eumeta variegata TaxID=151549 RepID=A0A4C1XY70_EUMVA|nr:hypothetical protein EVAR_51326_1 [Eumeta japonica]
MLRTKEALKRLADDGTRPAQNKLISVGQGLKGRWSSNSLSLYNYTRAAGIKSGGAGAHSVTLKHFNVAEYLVDGTTASWGVCGSRGLA